MLRPVRLSKPTKTCSGPTRRNSPRKWSIEVKVDFVDGKHQPADRGDLEQRRRSRLSYRLHGCADIYADKLIELTDVAGLSRQRYGG